MKDAREFYWCNLKGFADFMVLSQDQQEFVKSPSIEFVKAKELSG